MKSTGFKKRTTSLARVSRNPANIALRKKKAKAVTITKLNERLWAVTRQIVFKIYGTDCYTCPATYLEGRNLQGGHMPWPHSILSKECAYDVRYIRPQCLTCNIHRNGMGAVALKKMQSEGIDLDALWQHNLVTKGGSYGRKWTVEKIAAYEALNATL